jgi:1-acyl-sn-glycerol-3-phosphate acyltransferase
VTAARTDAKDRPVQLQGSAWARRLLEAAGWQIRFNGLPGKQGVAIVYPHTSNWDFPVGILAKWSIGFSPSFWGKESLFKVPLFGAWMRWVGGVPVNRKSPRGLVEQMIERVRTAKERDEFFWLVIAPEGTRGYHEHWRSGFYRVAHQADVPLALVYFDYAEKVVGFDRFMRLTGDTEADMAAIAEYLAHRHGRRPEMAGPVRLPPAKESRNE